MTSNQAYYAGKEAAARDSETVKAWAITFQSFAKDFWQGVRDTRGEAALDADTEWDEDRS